MEALVTRRPDPRFWRGRRVLLTGDTGFKGAWLALMLHRLGADVQGFALPPEPGPCVWRLAGVERLVSHRDGDLRDSAAVESAVTAAGASVVLHLAAQAIVTRGFADPTGTFETNVGGTIHLLEALRRHPGAETCVVATTDKVYRNDEDGRAFREGDRLGGHDPYSASKAACELVVQSWRASFRAALPPLATARAGNVIGGGDFGQDRLVPDLVRAVASRQTLTLRNPDSTRPFQHVLDVLVGYLLLAEDLVRKPGATPSALNFGPAGGDTRVRDLVAAFGTALGREVDWRLDEGPRPPEARLLALDPSLARRTLRWRAAMGRDEALRRTATWYAAWMAGDDLATRSLADVDAALVPVEEPAEATP